MTYIIDGHNLIPKIKGLDLTVVDDERQLIEKLQEFCLKQGKQVEVFFDNAPLGSKQKINTGRVKARFVRAGNTADQAIHRRLAEIGPNVKNFWVVSSDLRVQQSAREFQARTISSEEFAEMMALTPTERPPPEKDPDTSLDPDEVKEWEDFFKKKPD
jgi:uncharacterized protein